MKLRIRCKHKWELYGSPMYHEPLDLRSSKNISEEMLARLVFGQTVVTQRCMECGWLQTSIFAGQCWDVK